MNILNRNRILQQGTYKEEMKKNTPTSMLIPITNEKSEGCGLEICELL